MHRVERTHNIGYSQPHTRAQSGTSTSRLQPATDLHVHRVEPHHSGYGYNRQVFTCTEWNLTIQATATTDRSTRAQSGTPPYKLQPQQTYTYTGSNLTIQATAATYTCTEWKVGR